MMTDEEMIDCPEDTLQMARLRAVMHRLRSPGGCPWDAEQTHESLVSNLIEETYETVDTIRRGDIDHMKEELGDVLLQVVFHSEIAEGNGHFTFDDVARGISDKLVRRHPHVYAQSDASDSEAVLKQWDEIKAQEKKDKPAKTYLDGVGEGLPALLRAAKIQKKAAKVGFDWPDAVSIMSKIQEELEEVQEELDSHSEGSTPSEELKNEIGDLLFVIVNLARKLKLNPEELVDRTNLKFINRFGRMEKQLEQQGVSLSEAALEQMEQEWVKQKQND